MAEKRPEIAPGITVDRANGMGKPVLKGTAVEVARVLERLASGVSFEKLEQEAQVTREGILAAIAYAAEIVADEPQVRTLAENEAAFELSPGITADPRVRFGKPVLKGTRVDVASLLGYLGAGEALESLVAEYSRSPDSVRDALRYGHKLVSSETVSAH